MLGLKRYFLAVILLVGLTFHFRAKAMEGDLACAYLEYNYKVLFGSDFSFDWVGCWYKKDLDRKGYFYYLVWLRSYIDDVDSWILRAVVIAGGLAELDRGVPTKTSHALITILNPTGAPFALAFNLHKVRACLGRYKNPESKQQCILKEAIYKGR